MLMLSLLIDSKTRSTYAYCGDLFFSGQSSFISTSIKGRYGESCLLGPCQLDFWLMDKAEIKQIADYIKDLEEGLDQQDCRGLADLGHVTKLHLIIRRLMEATFQTTDRRLKPLLATLEMKARRCKDCIETRLAVRN